MMAAPMTGNPDHDFSAMMIPHHQGAIDMAKAFLLHGKDPALRRLAEEIIVTQRQEIEVMRLRLAAMKAGPPRPTADDADQTATAPCRLRAMTASTPPTRPRTPFRSSIPARTNCSGVIRLGDPVPGALSPLYKGQLLVHGLGFSPDHRTLAVVSIGSNSVTFIDTATNRVKGVVYVGRSPHEAFFTPDGRELWAAVRGEDYVSVIDPVKMKETRRVRTANGPGMVLFRPDGRYAFVPSSFTPELDVVDTRHLRGRGPRAAGQPVLAEPGGEPGRNGGLVHAEGLGQDAGDERAAAVPHPRHARHRPDHQSRRARGQRQRQVRLRDGRRGERREGLPPRREAGAGRHHPHRRSAARHLGDRATERGSTSAWRTRTRSLAIDTRTNKVLADDSRSASSRRRSSTFRTPCPAGEGTANLMPLGEAGKAAHLKLIGAAAGGENAGACDGSVNSLGALDLLQIAVSGLKPGQDTRSGWSPRGPRRSGEKEALVTFKANPPGRRSRRRSVRCVGSWPWGRKDDGQVGRVRYLLITEEGSDAPQLIQTERTPGPP